MASSCRNPERLRQIVLINHSNKRHVTRFAPFCKKTLPLRMVVVGPEERGGEKLTDTVRGERSRLNGRCNIHWSNSLPLPSVYCQRTTPLASDQSQRFFSAVDRQERRKLEDTGQILRGSDSRGWRETRPDSFFILGIFILSPRRRDRSNIS